METFAQNVVSASIMNLAEEVMVPVLMDARLDIYLIYAKVVKVYLWNMAAVNVNQPSDVPYL